MADEVKLYVQGQEYAGWKDVSITRSLTAIAGKFELSITDSWDKSKSNWTLAPGKSCVVKIGSDVILTGFIDQLETSVSGSDRKISVSGRDKTCDLVDCSIPAVPSSYSNIDLFSFAVRLCAPFGITVLKQTSVGDLIRAHRVQTGETIHAVLDKWARRRGVLMTTDGLGRLVIIAVGGAAASVGLVQGENLKTIELTIDNTQRFHSYQIKTQIPGDDDLAAAFSTGADAVAIDKGITRNRTLLILAEEAMNPAQLKTRIQWEAAYRAAEGMIIHAEVVGWRQTVGGTLWAPNQRVNVDAPAIGIRRELLVGEVTFVQSESEGTITKMKLARKDAYQPKPEVDQLADWSNGSDVSK